MLEWVAICYSRGSSQPRHQTCSLVFPALAAEFLPLVPPGKHICTCTHTHIYIYLSVLYLFAFSYCSWCSQGKNTEVVCHFHLQWTMFCQNSTMTCLSWVALQGMAHSFIELDKALVRVISLVSFL